MSGFNYYPEFQAPVTQQGVITNYTWVPLGQTVYNNAPAAKAAAEASSYYHVYDMRIVKSSWEVVESIPKL